MINLMGMTIESPAEPLLTPAQPDGKAYAAEVDALIRDAEESRVLFMKKRQTRGFIVSTVSLVSMIGGSIGFGWYFLMEGDLAKAVGCVALSVTPQMLLGGWIEAPLKHNSKFHKAQIMPRMAKLLGGFRYSRAGGISAKVLNGTGIVPTHDRYKHEDCFIGVYKGIKVLFSEARLYKRSENIFKGVFVLLELPKPVFKGNVIVTADQTLVQNCADTRWKSLNSVYNTTAIEQAKQFQIFADKPEITQQIINEQFLKELAEAREVFGLSALSISFTREKYVFMAIPHDKNMFEASDVLVPVKTRRHIESMRREFQKLLEVIDVINLYAV